MEKITSIVLVTGATSGFGEAIALKFAENGFDCIITGRRAEKLQALAAEIGTRFGRQCLPLCFDVRDRHRVASAIDGLEGKWKHIDVLINNAGLAVGRDPFDKCDIDDWETMIDTNLKGLLYVSRAVSPLMVANGSGHIINIGSVAGKEVYKEGNVYCATKHAVDALGKAMRIDLLPYGIKVTNIHPGAADTAFSTVRFKGDEAKAAAVYEGFEPLHANDVADIALYCASLPAHVCINDLVVTCTAQANATLVKKS